MPRSSLSFVIAALALGAATCSGPVEEGIPLEAHRLYQEQKYDEMTTVLKTYLLRNPNDAAAHFYLGQCYLRSRRNFRPEHAKGEFRTALHLFLRNGKRSPIKGFSEQYFEMICHIERAKVSLRLIQESIELGGVPWLVAAYLRECETDFEAAREIAPDSKDVEQLELLIKTISRVVSEGPHPPREAPVGFHI